MATEGALPAHIDRDQWGRPKIKQPTGKPVGYRRPSTLCKALDDGTNLTAWKQRMTALGLDMRVDLAARVGDLRDEFDNPATDARDELNRICTEAMDSAGAAVRRDLGTELHAVAEAVDLGAPLDSVPEALRADLDAYLWGTSELEVLATELFVVVDEIRAAGTLDRLNRLPDGRVVVGDLKTGKWDALYPMAVEMQVSTYAHGERYDHATGARSPIHPDLDRSVGLLIHAPAGTASCELYELDLHRGWANVLLALQVADARKAAGKKLTPASWVVAA